MSQFLKVVLDRILKRKLNAGLLALSKFTNQVEKKKRAAFFIGSFLN
jgi:hypothetical protein